VCFEIIGKIENIEEIAVDGKIRKAELHWYEAHGIGKRKMKIKSFLD
jgi:hypothetical protein